MATKINPANQIADGTLPPGVIASTLGLPGWIIDFAGPAAPAGFLACPTAAGGAQLVSRTTYAALFAAIGTYWGAGDGSTTFGIPWFPADYAAVQANANVGTDTVGQVINHTHPDGILNSPNNNWPGMPAGTSSGYATSVGYLQNTGNPTGGGAANLAAGVRVLKCVKF